MTTAPVIARNQRRNSAQRGRSIRVIAFHAAMP
jgi:hypothetical protein